MCTYMRRYTQAYNEYKCIPICKLNILLVYCIGLCIPCISTLITDTHFEPKLPTNNNNQGNHKILICLNKIS